MRPRARRRSLGLDQQSPCREIAVQTWADVAPEAMNVNTAGGWGQHLGRRQAGEARETT